MPLRPDEGVTLPYVLCGRPPKPTTQSDRSVWLRFAPRCTTMSIDAGARSWI